MDMQPGSLKHRHYNHAARRVLVARYIIVHKKVRKNNHNVHKNINFGTTMSVPVCPTDNILVTLDSKYRDQTNNGLVIDTGFNPGVHATVTGKVVSVPQKIGSHFQRRLIHPEVKVGDDIAFSYRVVYNQEATDNAREIFYEVPLANPFITKWANQKGEYLARINRGGGRFDAVFHIVENNQPVIIEKVENVDCEAANDFIDNHLKSANTFIRYKNCLWDGENEYWMVDYMAAFMVRRGNQFVMVGGYALLEHPGGKIDRGDVSTSLELWGDARRDIDKELKVKLVAIGEPLKGQPKLSVIPGETVVINKLTAQEYNFWGNDYLLVRQDQILGKA